MRTPSRRVTEAIIAEMVSLCREHGIPMVFTFIDGRPYMMDYVRTLGIPTVDMHVDMSVPENTNTPHDGHPSALANRHYASVLEPALRQVLDDPVVRP